MALMLTPLIRIISLTLPLSEIGAPYRYLFAGVPMLIGADYGGPVRWAPTELDRD